MSYSQIRRVLKALDVPSRAAQVEVMPTQHFLMGGIATDEFGAAAIPGLYAVGEVAGGAHGAHRLATCGGTEVIAMGAIVGENAAQYACGRKPCAGERRPAPRPELLQAGMDAGAQARLARIRVALEQGCGALRDAQGLRASLSELERLRDELAGDGALQTFVGRAVLVALSIATSALARTESRGDHFRIDHPQRDDRRWLGNVRASLGDQGSEVTLSYQRAGVNTRTAAPMPATDR